jgi:uncharacterized membrane protein YqiK
LREELRQDASAHCEDMRDKWRDMIDAVEFVENLVSLGIEPSDKEQKAHDDARPSVQKWRDGLARANDTRVAIAAANAAAAEAAAAEAKAAKAAAAAEAKAAKAAKAAAAAEAKAAKAAAVAEAKAAKAAAVAEAKAAKAAAVAEAKSAKAAAAAEARTAKAAAVAEAKAAKAAAAAEARTAKEAAAREPRVSAVREVLLRGCKNGLALPRIAEDVKAFAAFENMPPALRAAVVRTILQVPVHGRKLFKQTCSEDRAVGTLAKYGVMSESDADDERS